MSYFTKIQVFDPTSNVADVTPYGELGNFGIWRTGIERIDERFDRYMGRNACI